MKIALFVKILVMVVMLVAVIAVMRGTDKGAVQSAFDSLGIADGGVSGTANQANSLNLCRTRIRALTFPDGGAVEEAKGRLKLLWMARDPQKSDQIADQKIREINTIAVEKWLSLHCIITIEPTEDIPEGAEFRDYLTLSYIDGKDSPIRRSGDGLFSFEGRLFHSSDLEGAVKDLREIAGLTEAIP